jgi:hypothetical protein
MIWTSCDEGRLLPFTIVYAERATSRKHAPTSRYRGVFALHRRRERLDVRIDGQLRPEQELCVRMRWVVQDFADRALLDQAAVVHDRDPITDTANRM